MNDFFLRILVKLSSYDKGVNLLNSDISGDCISYPLIIIDRVFISQNVELSSENGGFQKNLKGKVIRISPQVKQRKVLSTDPRGAADSRIIEVLVQLDQESKDMVEEDVSTEESEVETEAEVDDQSAADDTDEESEQYDEESEEEVTEDIYIAKVDGQEVEVTAEDLIKSYQLEQTAQKRLREAAEERKKIQSDAQQVEAERKYYAENLALLQEQLKQYQNGNMTDQQWAELYQSLYLQMN